jgi:hypothetical protein
LGVFNDNLLKNCIIFISAAWAMPSWITQSQLISIVSAALIIPYLVLSPVAGRLSVIYSKKNVFRFFKLLELPIMLTACFAFYYQWVLLAIFAVLLMGIQSCLYSPSKYSLIRDIGGEEGVSYGSGIFETMAFLGILLGTVTASLLSDFARPWLVYSLFIGVAMAAGNLGKTKNQGVELELKHNNRIGKDFYYNVGFTFSHARNEILDMDEPDAKTGYRKQEGHPINQYFGLICDGFVTQADLDNPNFPKSTYGNVQVGDLKYRDMNGDGFIDDRDETFIGYSDIPENTYALTLGAQWKGIGFSVMFQGVDHVSRFYDAEAMFAFVNGGKVKEHHLGRWNPAMSEEYNLANATYPLLHYDSYGNHNQRQNSFFLKNGAFLRLKNIELSYSLPQSWIKKAAMKECRIYVNASNLVTWDHLGGLTDPESNGSNRYPIMKTVNFGVNIQF